MKAFHPDKTCIVCGATYAKKASVSVKSWTASRYCSVKCINIGRTPATKGKKTGKPAWNSGRTCPQTTGEKNGAWKGGIDHKTLRRLVLKRDDYTCQVCGMRDMDIMQVDHIAPKAIAKHLKTTPENLMTLCPNCHARKTVRELREGISHRGRKLRLIASAG